MTPWMKKAPMLRHRPDAGADVAIVAIDRTSACGRRRPVRGARR
jgi:hypothetical protein